MKEAWRFNPFIASNIIALEAFIVQLPSYIILNLKTVIMSTRIYSTDTDAGQITVIEKLGHNKFKNLCEIAIGNAPRGSVKFTKDGRGYVSNCGGNTISEIDVFTNRETARITVGFAPRGIGIVPGDRFALVSNSGSNYVSVVDLAKREEIHKISVGRDPRHMAITNDGHFAFVSIWGSHYVSKIDIRPLEESRFEKIMDVREVARIPVGEKSHPYSVALDKDNSNLYVANTQAHYISIIDTQNACEVKRVDLGHKGSRAIAFTPDQNFALVTIEDTAEVVAISTRTQEVTERFIVGPGPRGIAIDPTDFSIYTSAFARTEIKRFKDDSFVFEPNTLTVLNLFESDNAKFRNRPKYEQIHVGTGPCSVAVIDLDSLR